MNKLELLKQGYKNFAEGNIDAVIAIWHPDIEWKACTGIPYINSNGIYKGSQEIVNGVFAQIPNYFEDFNIEISDLIDGGDKIVMVGFYTGTWKATGKKFTANATNIWTFKGEKISHFFEAADSAEIMNP
ncbi:MAG TPA: nuclear transport factor 2 family protein [Prolixibacteraceae bacterium]|nr:nuclear transport factor 2 family protein [Prolixibacteraceae bacterium]